MTDLYPLLSLGLIGCIWLAAFIQGARLYRTFLHKYPDVASKSIPFAFDELNHPEKLLFFFRRTSLTLLKSDVELWKLRQQMVFLLCLSLIVPLLCFAILGIVAIRS
jgi:hypothetical protein